MRKALKLVLPLFVATIALLMAPTAYATPSKTGCGWKTGGGWFTNNDPPDPNVEMWSVDGNVIVHAWGGGGVMYGTLSGIWIHDEWDIVRPNGVVIFYGTWDTPYGVTVDGVTGTIHVCYWGIADANTGTFHGQWVIISGTGGLAHLHGYGTMWGDQVSAEYTMTYRFDP